MERKTLRVGRSLGLHRNDDGWLVVGRPGLERTTDYLDRDGELALTFADGSVWTFHKIKAFGMHHFSGTLKEVADV